MKDGRMTNVSCHIDKAAEHLESASRRVSPFIEHFARFGYAAKGVVYFIIGLLGALAPIGLSDRPTGQRGALAALLRQPTGSLLLIVAAAGLVCFGIFQFIRAVEDPEHAGWTFKGVIKRAGWLANAFAQFALVAAALNMMIGYHRAAADDDARVRDWTATALSYPFGRWVIAIIGGCVIAYGVQQVLAGFGGRLDRRLDLDDLTDAAHRWLCGISRFGVAARGAVFAALGYFLVVAAYHANAHEAYGLGGTLRTLATEAFGRWILALSAAGLIAYGLYDFVLARYRRIPVPVTGS
jgi:hypothetical protein